MKVFVIASCGILFFIQLYGLIYQFIQFPTSINTEIKFNIKQTEIPSISVCYHYILLIEKDELMKLDPNFNQTITQVKSQVNEFESDGVKLETSWKTLRKIFIKNGININQVTQTFIQHPIRHCYLSNQYGESIPCEKVTNITVTHDDKYRCFTLFHQTFKKRKSNPLMMNVPLKESRPFLRFYILFNNSNSLHPPRRVQLVIHAPHVNPLDHFRSSIELEMKSYQIAYSKTNAVLLPKPYQTNYMNYGEYTQHDTQLDCLNSCLAKLGWERCSCWPSSIQSLNLSQLDQLCWLIKPNQHNCTLEIESECQQICQSPDCYQEKYTFEVRSYHERKRESRYQWIRELKSTTAKVIVLTPFNFETTFIHNPENTLTQLICYIVSLLGFWYGISVISMYNFVSEKVKLFKKKKNKIIVIHINDTYHRY